MYFFMSAVFLFCLFDQIINKQKSFYGLNILIHIYYGDISNIQGH